MKFLLFSNISFEVPEPIALIESYCFQNDFYANYDLLTNRKVKDANKIGARISRKLLERCENITDDAKDLSMFEYDLDRFLRLDDEAMNNHIKELNERVIKRLLEIRGIGLSKATKILHTLYPEIIPMIDDPLQELYHGQINLEWSVEYPSQILIDYYKNLREDDNVQHLTQVFDSISKNNLVGLTKVRIFDILWWSYLKSQRLIQKLKVDRNITLSWSTIK